MKKIFQSKTSSKTKNKKTTKQENNSTSPPLIYYNDLKAFEILDVWNDITNWNIDNFPKVLKLANISLPITINMSDPSASKLYCVDKDNVPFTITLKFFCSFTFSKIFIEFENESFLYNLNNNIPNTTESLELILIEHVIRTYGYSNEIYSLVYDIQTQTITQTLLVNGSEFVYTVEYKLLDVERKDLLNKLLKRNGLGKTFDNLKSSTSLLKNIIKNLNLTTDDLKDLEINITFKYCDVTFSKISISKNIITKLSFTTDDGYHNLYNTGKLVFTSGDKNISFVINDISKCFNKNSICIEDFNSIIEYANKMFEKLKNNDLLKD